MEGFVWEVPITGGAALITKHFSCNMFTFSNLNSKLLISCKHQMDGQACKGVGEHRTRLNNPG